MGLACGIFPLIAFAAIVFSVWSYYVERKKPVTYQAAPVNAPVGLLFQIGHPWRRVTERRR
jgi:hypothetical protein